MIHTFDAAVHDGYSYVRKHPQLLLTVFLILVIPIAFIISGQKFLDIAHKNQDSLERERIGSIHAYVALLLNVHSNDTIVFQEKALDFMSQFSDIVDFEIVQEKEGNFDIFYTTSSQEYDKEMVLSEKYQRSLISPGTVIIFPKSKDSVRIFETVTALPTARDGSRFYVSIEFSRAHTDAIFAERIREAYYWLFGILGVILLLIIRHVRMIDYAYLYKETKRANEMKDIFTNTVAHELRAPLTAIRGYASLLLEQTPKNDARYNDIQKIETSSLRLLSIINDLLDIARMHSGKLSVKNIPTNIVPTIASVIDTLSLPAKEKNITLEFDKTQPDLFILVDEKRLAQVLTNVMSNSIKYTERGTIATTLTTSADKTIIRIKDTGRGISAQNQKQLFAPFFRVSDDYTDATLGTGLGMWITKQLVEQMKGTIDIESIEGVGTHVIITLPSK